MDMTGCDDINHALDIVMSCEIEYLMYDVRKQGTKFMSTLTSDNLVSNHCLPLANILLLSVNHYI